MPSETNQQENILSTMNGSKSSAQKKGNEQIKPVICIIFP